MSGTRLCCLRSHAEAKAAETIADMMANGTTTKKYQIALEAWRKAAGKI